MASIEAGDRVRIHPKRFQDIRRVYPWLATKTWWPVADTHKVGRRVQVRIQGRGEDGAWLWKMDVRKPRPGAERKLAESEA